MQDKEVEDLDLKELIQAVENKIGPKYSGDETKVEENFKNYLDNFDKEYYTHLKEKVKEIPLLINVFRKLIDEIFELNEFQLAVLQKQVSIENELLKNLTSDQIQLLEQLQKCGNILNSEMVEQAFIFGYSTAVELRDEAIKQYPQNKNE